MNKKIIYILFLHQYPEIILLKYSHHQSNSYFDKSVLKLNRHFLNIQVSDFKENKQLMVFLLEKLKLNFQLQCLNNHIQIYMNFHICHSCLQLERFLKIKTQFLN